MWSKLSGEKPAPGEKSAEEDPGASLMNMMKKMYDEGDDTMKKVTPKIKDTCCFRPPP